uniref:Uncharacterized protein n=1 Tax=Rhizophora mucronata TaxID=61149 RepID=A0A2P2J389_RHIMU
MRQRCHWNLMLSSRLVVSVRWTKQPRNEMSRMAGV